MKIAPTHRTVAAWVLLTALGCIGGFFPAAVAVWKVAAGLLLGVLLVDLLLCLKKPAVTVQRKIHHSLPVTAWSSVELQVTCHDNRRLSAWLHDVPGPEFLIRDLPAHIVLEPGQQAACTYSLYPTRRGKYVVSGVDLIACSPLGLWRKKWHFACPETIRIFPNYREVGHYTLLAGQHDLNLMGIKKLLRRGEGMDFHQLREYRQGDAPAKIDWKASSRYRKLISREFEDERNQQIVFVLDSGRRMGHAETGRTHLDQALNSILLLAYVATRQGDAVGLYSFGGTAKWHPPKKEEDAVRSLLLTAYDIETTAHPADYLKATRELTAMQSRRALMIVITNSRSEDHDDLLQMARQLRKKHLVVIADIRESILDQWVVRPVAGFEDAIRYQALQQYLFERRALLHQMHHLGILSLDVTAEQLPVALVNRYLEIKSSGFL